MLLLIQRSCCRPSANYRDNTASREFVDRLGRARLFPLLNADPRVGPLPSALPSQSPIFEHTNPSRLHYEALARLKCISQRELHDARLCQQARIGAEAVRLLRQ